MKRKNNLLLVFVALCVLCLGILQSQESKHKMKAEVKVDDVTLSQATELERKLREIRVYGNDGKPLKIEIKVKME